MRSTECISPGYRDNPRYQGTPPISKGAIMTRFTKAFILLLLAALFIPETADAQLLKRLKDRAKERVEKKVEDKADQAVDKAVDEAAEDVESAAKSAFERRSRAEALDLGPNAVGPADAPHVRYRSTTSMNLGMLGRMARFLGKELETQSETVSISGLRQRTDAGDQSTILDLENGSMIMLDHEKRQYTVMTFDEMVERMDDALAEMKNQDDQPEQADGSGQEIDADVEFDMSVERTGRAESINGAPSEQLLLTMRADFDIQGTDENGEEASVRGTTYALVDTWTSSDIAGLKTIQNFERYAGEQMGASLQQSDFGSSLQAMGMDPRTGELIEEAGKEMQKLDGLVVRSTTHLILVPEGQALDVEAALNPPSGQEGGGANAFAQMAAGTEEGGNAAPAEQVTLMRITTQISDLQVDPLPADHFEITPDYKKVDLF